MHYYLYKLTFPYGVHFGADKAGIGLEKVSFNCHCDTLYSAICLEILKLYGQSELAKFYNDTVDGKFWLSDLLPYKEQELLIPKPILYLDSSEEKEVSDSVKKKQMKKLQFVPISKLNEFFSGDIEEIKFAEICLYEKNAPSRNGIDSENGLYSISVTKFYQNCGLYFIVKMEEDKEEWFRKVITSLGYSGIGGKRTSGYGQFKIEDDFSLEEDSNIQNEAIMAKLLNKQAKYYLTLSAFSPQIDEIENIKNGYYSLVRRQGFIQSLTYSSSPLKKNSIVKINAGSCFEKKFNGTVLDVGENGEHPVYSYGKPIMIGIDV